MTPSHNASGSGTFALWPLADAQFVEGVRVSAPKCRPLGALVRYWSKRGTPHARSLHTAQCNRERGSAREASLPIALNGDFRSAQVHSLHEQRTPLKAIMSLTAHDRSPLDGPTGLPSARYRPCKDDYKLNMNRQVWGQLIFGIRGLPNDFHLR